MLFWFKKKPIELFYYSDIPELYTHAPIKSNTSFIPEWWKSAPSSVRMNNHFYDHSTIKRCPGFINYYKNGISIPLWSDLALLIGPVGSGFFRYQFANMRSSIDTHREHETNYKFKDEDYQHIKLISPWFLHCREDIKFLFTEPTWSFIGYTSMRVLPGIIDYKYQNSTNVNIMIRRNRDNQEIQLPFKEPIANLFPLSDRPIKLIQGEEKDMDKTIRVNLYFSKFVNKYKTNRKTLKDLEKK